MRRAIGCLGVALLLGAASARAEDAVEPEHEMGRAAKKLGLTDEQQAKLKEARRARRDAAEPLHAELKAAINKLSDQLEDKASEKELSGTLDRVKKARAAMRAEEDKLESAMASILTPSQRAKMLVGMSRGPRAMRGRPGLGGPGMDGARGRRRAMGKDGPPPDEKDGAGEKDDDAEDND